MNNNKPIDDFNKKFYELLNDNNTENATLENLEVNEEEIKTTDDNLLNSVKQIINKDAHIDEQKEEELFGYYEVVYQDNSLPKETYAKLNEDVIINQYTHDTDNTILDNANKYANKYQKERAELSQNFDFNNQEHNISYIRSLIEGAIYVVGSEGIAINDIKRITNIPIALINSILDEMINYYSKNKNSGLLLVQYGNKFKFVTKSELNEQIGLIINKKSRKPLSEGVIETLSIIAYNQPCTKSTIEKIRSKDCTSTIQRLLEIGLIETDGKSDAIGKPWLYSVTQKFFDLYGIKSLNELPTINRDYKNYDDNNKNIDSDDQYIDYE